MTSTLTALRAVTLRPAERDQGRSATSDKRLRRGHDSSSALDFGYDLAVFLAQGGPGEQVGAVAKSFFERSLAAPAPDFFVVAADEHFRDSPTVELRRASVVRAIENAPAAPAGRGAARTGGLKSRTGFQRACSG